MDYELTLTVKNAPLLNLMRERGFTSVASLAKAIGIGRGALDKLAKLERGVYMADGITPLPSSQRIADFFYCAVENLVPASHIRDPLKQSKFVAQVAENQMAEIAQAAQNPERLLEIFETESRDAFADMLDASGLNDRHRKVMDLRYRENKTYEECGKILGVTGERIRQMELKAIRIIRLKAQKCVIKAAGIYADSTGHGA